MDVEVYYVMVWGMAFWGYWTEYYKVVDALKVEEDEEVIIKEKGEVEDF